MPKKIRLGEGSLDHAPETWGWLLARIQREWPHTTLHDRAVMAKFVPEWIRRAEVEMDAPFLGYREEREFTPGINVPPDMLAVFASDLLNDWPHMSPKLRRHYAAGCPEVVEVSGVKMDAPYLGGDPFENDPDLDDIPEE